MLFDQRTRQALLSAGVEAETLSDIEAEVAADAREEAQRIEAFFADRGATGPETEATATVYSDMDQTHTASEYPRHTVEYVDLFTHSQEIRGWLRFESWGVSVAGGRVLSDSVVELTLGPTVQDRVRFAADRDQLE